MQGAVCFFGFEEREEGGRSWALHTGLAERGIPVAFCRTNAPGMLAKYRDLYRKWQQVEGGVSALYVIFMGYYLMPLAWILARRKGIPIVLDAFVSQYDTEVNDRKRISRWSPRAWLLWTIDFAACHAADAILVDTPAHGDYFAQHYFIRREKILVAPIGCRTDLFVPSDAPTRALRTILVEFHGTFIPLQGIEHILEAAKLLQDRGEDIRFLLIGAGQTFEANVRHAEALGLTNVEFVGRKSPTEIPGYVTSADICLGIFGTTDKALRVIPNKVYECLAAGKAVITERSPASSAWIRDGEEAYLVEPGNGADLAEKIQELARSSEARARLGARARALTLARFSPRAIVGDLVQWLESRA